MSLTRGGSGEVSADLFVQTSIWNYFKDKNEFTDYQIAGIMGNIQQECMWNPLVINQSNGRWGLIQIDSGSASHLNDLYKAAGLDMSLYDYSITTYQGAGAHQDISTEDLDKIMEVQLDYIYDHKPTGSDWKSKLRETTSVEHAAECFAIYCEGCVVFNVSGQSNETKLLYYPNNKYQHFQDVKDRRENAVEILENSNQYN